MSEEKLPEGFRVIEYPFHMGDLIGGTAHLTNAQFGGYMRIILALIQKPDGLTIKQIRSYSRMPGKYWPDFWDLVGGKFVDNDGIIHHDRTRKTVHKLACKSAQNRDNRLKYLDSTSTNVKPEDNKRSTNHQTNKPYKDSFSRYSVEIFLKDDDWVLFRRDFKGWDIHHFIGEFNAFIIKKQEYPSYPAKALHGFITKATKGKKP